MSCRLLVMLIFIIFRLKSKFMILSSSLSHIEDCFYEKRIHTSLNGYNDLHSRWISELDCLERCLKSKPQRCRSFEYWRSPRYGLCVRANISLTDQPSSIGPNLFVDYYEIDCRRDTKAVRIQTTSCPGDELSLLITLNGIDPNYALLGDSNCKPIWSNETHAQFVTHVDNCTLLLTDGSIIGKLRWEGVDKDTNEARQYERFFLCPSDIYQIRSAHWTSTTMGTPITTTFTKSIPLITTTRRRVSSPIYNDDGPVSATDRISLRWILHNRTYICPQICSVSLYSHIHVSFHDISVLSSTFLIDSCDLIALFPYSDYLQTRRLIYRGCSTDPTMIHLSSEMNSLSKFHYSFYLYNILKEPIPFQIQCKISTNQEKQFINHTSCSSFIFNDNDQLSIIRNEKRDYSYTLFRSSPVNVIRQLPSNLLGQSHTHFSNCITSIFAVHHFLFAFSAIVHWTF